MYCSLHYSAAGRCARRVKLHNYTGAVRVGQIIGVPRQQHQETRVESVLLTYIRNSRVCFCPRVHPPRTNGSFWKQFEDCGLGHGSETDNDEHAVRINLRLNVCKVDREVYPAERRRKTDPNTVMWMSYCGRPSALGDVRSACAVRVEASSLVPYPGWPAAKKL